MNGQLLKTLILGAAISSLSAFPVYADETEDFQAIDTVIAEIDERPLSTGEDKVINKIADDFTEVSGGEDNARSLISGLRTDGEIIIDDVAYTSPTDAMGFGGTFISMALAEELIETSDQYTNIADALGLDAVEDDVTIDVIDNSQQILVMRESGMGWGEIAKELGFNMGEVISSIRSSRPDRPESTAKADHRSKPERTAQTGRPEKPERIEKASKADRPERPERIERVSKPERPERPERIERISRPERPERPERIERVSRPERPERPDRPGRG